MTILWTGHPSYLGYIPYYVFGVLFIILGYVHSFFAIWTFVLGASMIAVSLFDRNNKVYTITDRKIMARAHMHRYRDEIDIKEITAVNLTSGLVEKIFGLGTVRITTEMETDDNGAKVAVHIDFKGISDSQQVADKIEDIRGQSGFTGNEWQSL